MTLIRKTPLKRGKLRPMSKRRKSRLAAWVKVTLARMVRVGNRCERCGRGPSPVRRLVGHHALPKSQGGEDTDENCRILCECTVEEGCHPHVHRNPEESYAAGWMIRRPQHGGRE